MKRIFSLILSVCILFSGITYTVQQAEKPVFAFDCDDVISSRSCEPTKVVTVLAKIAVKHPVMVAYGIVNFNKVRQIAKEASKNNNGSANIIDAVVEQLKTEGYGDLTDLKDELLDAFTSPKPYLPILTLMKQLHDAGYTVVTATNQDTKHHEIYRKKIATFAPEFDLDKITDKTIAHNYKNSPAQCNNGVCTIDNRNHGVENAAKPDIAYFEAIKTITGSNNIFFFDDKLKNIKGAQQAGIKAEQFDNSKHSIEKVTTFLKSHGIELQPINN
jgi:FMN phosphatase YigB (HAD superfamily)